MRTNCVIYLWSHPEQGGACKLSVRWLQVDAGGAIDASLRGFRGGIGAENGYGPGGGTYASGYGGPAGHGGAGGGGRSGGIYGSIDRPVTAGSGGGAASTMAGNGGGVIWIEARDTIQVDGALLANGGNGSGQWRAGPGSGGSVLLITPIVQGRGRIEAIGGHGEVTYMGGAGGGRVAIAFDPFRQARTDPPSALTISALNGSGVRNGRMGTLSFPDETLLAPVISMSGYLHFPVSETVIPHSLTLSNCHAGFATAQVVRVQGDLTLAPNAALTLHAGPTNAAEHYGGLLAVAGDLTLATNCTLYLHPHSQNGGAVKIAAAAGNVHSGALISAIANGFAAASGPGAGAYRRGGGHGGAGGGGSGSGGTNGVWYLPLVPGSGGGDTGGGGVGGGVVWIVTEEGGIHLDGLINATGGAGYYGAGAGGAIVLISRYTSGNGTLRADGGVGNTTWGGGGGGGRIAVINADPAGYEMLRAGRTTGFLFRAPPVGWTTSVVPGTGMAPAAQPGSVIFGYQMGTVIVAR